MTAMAMGRTVDLSACGRYRYRLEQQLPGAGYPLVFVMLNPSTADAERDDPTLRRCVGFARAAGARSVVLVNLYALRTPYPAVLRARLLDDADVVGPRNDEVLAAAAASDGTVVAAWGPPKWRFVAARAAQVARDLRAAGVVLHALRVTDRGHPWHPLMVPSACAPEPWAGVC